MKLLFIKYLVVTIVIVGCEKQQTSTEKDYWININKDSNDTIYKIEYFPNGKISVKAPLVDQKKNGIAKYYSIDGKIAMEFTYKNDLRCGEFIQYFPDGKIMRKGYFENDHPIGSETFYDKNFNIIKIVYFDSAGTIIKTTEF